MYVQTCAKVFPHTQTQTHTHTYSCRGHFKINYIFTLKVKGKTFEHIFSFVAKRRPVQCHSANAYCPFRLMRKNATFPFVFIKFSCFNSSCQLLLFQLGLVQYACQNMFYMFVLVLFICLDICWHIPLGGILNFILIGMEKSFWYWF